MTDPSLVRRAERALSAVGNRRGLAVVTVGVAALLTSAVPYLVHSRTMEPFSSWSFFSAYDEFSYLLAADTYASGRITNETHVMWPHFTTQTVLHQPTYQSIYPPGQGLFLAAGKLITGHAIVGVWISMALACAATCYLLQAWFPPRWALAGGLLAAFNARMAIEWGGTYWGGAVAMLGGALAFGALQRLLRRPSIRHSLLFAVGLGLLANTRPFEGLTASVPALVLLGWLLFAGTHPLRLRLGKILAPILAACLVIGAGMAFYNYRVTGNPWTLPYQIYLANQGGELPFIWQEHEEEPPLADSGWEEASSVPLAFEDAAAVDEEAMVPADEEWWLPSLYLALLMHPWPIVAVPFKLLVQWAFYLGPVLTIPLVALAWVARRRFVWLALSTLALTLLAVLATTGAYPHYLAPAAPLLFAVVLVGARSLGTWKRGARRIGRRWIAALAILWLVQFLLIVMLFPLLTARLRWGESRARIESHLRSIEGEHLVLVRYLPGHIFYKEWVYNEADIDRARVVWARELSNASNRRLLEYFHDRRVWVVEPDRHPPALLPYDRGLAAAGVLAR